MMFINLRKLSIRLSAVLAHLFLFGAHVAYAGVSSGGGGGVYVCPSEGKPDVELVDLFEAETIGLHIPYDNQTPLATQLAKATEKVTRISPLFGADVGKTLELVQTNQAGGPGVAIPKPTDVDEKYGKRGCTLQGMMYFDDNWGKLVRDTNLFDAQKTITDLTAAFLHEAIYKVMRDQNMPASNDSVLSRRIVGCVMSDKDVGECLNLKKTAPITQAGSWNCDVVNKQGTPISFTLYKTEPSTWGIQINKFGKDPILYQHRSVYYRDGMFGTGIPQYTGDFFASPDEGGGFVYIDGLGGLGNPMRRILPWVTVLKEKPVQVEIPNVGKKVNCTPVPNH